MISEILSTNKSSKPFKRKTCKKTDFKPTDEEKIEK